MESKRYQLNKTDLFKVLKVLGYSASSAIVGALIIVLGQIDLPAQWLFLVPVVNMLLVALQKFLTDSQGNLGVAIEK